MGGLYKGYPKDVDAGAFYALSLIAVKTETDTTLDQERKAMAVLVPLFKAYPDNPGVVHLHHPCVRLADDGAAGVGGGGSLWGDCAVGIPCGAYAGAYLRAVGDVGFGIKQRRRGDLLMDSHLRPHIALIIGVIAVGLGLMETISGEALGRYGRGASRRDEPQRFWKLVATSYLCGVAAIAYYFYDRLLAR